MVAWGRQQATTMYTCGCLVMMSSYLCHHDAPLEPVVLVGGVQDACPDTATADHDCLCLQNNDKVQSSSTGAAFSDTVQLCLAGDLAPLPTH